MAKRTTTGKGTRTTKSKADDSPSPETPKTEAATPDDPQTVTGSTDEPPKPTEGTDVSPKVDADAPKEDVADDVIEGSSTVPELRRPAEDTEDQPSGDGTTDTDTSGPVIADAPPSASSDSRTPERRSSLPMFFGGLIAGILGAVLLYGAAKTGIVDLQSQDAINQQRAQDSRLSDLSDELGSLSDQVANMQSDGTASLEELRSQIAGLSDDIAALSGRIEEIEVQPIPDAELPQEVVQAYERRFADMQAGLDARLADIEAAADRASEVEAAAEVRANTAAARAALAEVTGALQNGGPFAAALDEIAARTDAAIPDILSRNSAEGIPSAAALSEAFPPAARAAIDASLSSMAESGEIGGVQAFIRSQFGARSLEPRDGDDPDAILSRAEAALRDGDIDTAMSEIDGLPEAGRAEMTAWVEMATLRRDALAAADTLAQSLNES